MKTNSSNFHYLKIVLFTAFTFFLYSCGSAPSNIHIEDNANILNKDEIEFLEKYSNELVANFDIDLRIILNKNGYSKTELNKYAFEQMAHFAKSTVSSSGKQVVFIVDTKSNFARLEISGALESVYTDNFIAYIQKRHMVYFFKDNRIEDGILATTEMLFSRAQKSANGENFTPPNNIVMPTGAGSISNAQIGTKQLPAIEPNLSSDNFQPSKNKPYATLQMFIESSRAQNTDPNLAIYTSNTQEMFKTWTVTPVQMHNNVENFESCREIKKWTVTDQNKAVIVYPIKPRRCHPWFFKFEQGAWRLDLDTMQKDIKFNHLNQWHFTADHNEYSFAFSHLNFDENNYPVSYKKRKIRWGYTLDNYARNKTDYQNRSKPQTIVTKVVKEMPAYTKLGLRVEDIIIDVNGMPNPYYSQIITFTDKMKTGDILKMRVLRNGEILELNATFPD